MFPAYRSEEVQRHAPAGRDEPQEGGQRGIVTASVAPAATTSSYGSFKWTSAKESTTSGKVDEKYKRMKKQLQKEKKRREREELKRRELSKHSIKVVSLFSSDDDESGAEEEIMLEPMKITTKHKHSKKASRKHGKRRKHRKSRRSSRSRSRSRSSEKSRRRSRSRSRSESESSSSALYQSSSSGTARNSSSSNHSSNRRTKTDLELANAKALNNMKWSFMEKMIANQPSTFYILDRKLDRANSMYDSAYRYEVSKFTINTRQILGGNEQLNRAVFAQELAAAAKKREKRAVRYFDEAVRRTWSEQPERYWRSIETKVDMDVIPLSTEPLDVSELPEGEQVKNVLLDESVMEGLDLEKRSQKLNELLGRGENRRNIDLWFKFLAVQDQLHLQRTEAGEGNRRRGRNERLTDGLLLDRKLAILERALESNPESFELALERVRIGSYRWDRAELDRAVSLLENRYECNAKMWLGLLDFMRMDNRYKPNEQLAKMRECMSKVKVRTPAERAEIERFCAEVLRRRVKLLMQTGYTEKGVATLQAICEYNLCMPERIRKCGSNDRKKYFEAFWDSGIARIGDVNGAGWSSSVAMLMARKFETDEEECKKEYAEYEAAEKKLIDSYRKREGPRELTITVNALWVKIDKLRAEWNWRPIRDINSVGGVDQADAERYVSYADVEGALFDFESEEVVVQLVLDIIEELGGDIYGKESTSAQNMMLQLELPIPTVCSKLKDFDQFLQRVLSQLAQNLPQYNTRLQCSRITTAYAFIKRRPDASNMQLTFKRFREFGRNFFTPNTELENLSCYATFAEKLLEVGDKKKAQALGTFIKVSSVNIWDRKEESERLAALRLALVYVNALGDDSKKCDAIASIVLRGTLPDDDKPMVYKSVEVQDRLNILLNQAIKNGFRSWEGAVLDILATLSVAFVYHKASTSDRYRFLCTTYESLQKVLDLSEMPRFTKHFLNYLCEYVAANPNQSPKLMIARLDAAVRQYPRSISMLKLLIEKNKFGHNLIPLRRLLAEDVKDEVTQRCRAYGGFYLELLRYLKLMSVYEQRAPELRCVMNALKIAAEKTNYTDDYLPRIALSIANDRGEKELVNEIFYTAQSRFAWSRALIMDFASTDPDQMISLSDTMTERDIRLHCQHDEMGVIL